MVCDSNLSRALLYNWEITKINMLHWGKKLFCTCMCMFGAGSLRMCRKDETNNNNIVR
jgi:hypothetical protein